MSSTATAAAAATAAATATATEAPIRNGNLPQPGVNFIIWFTPYAQLLRSTPNFWEAFLWPQSLALDAQDRSWAFYCLWNRPQDDANPIHHRDNPNDVMTLRIDSTSEDLTKIKVKCRKSSHLATGYDLNYAGIVWYSNCSTCELKFKVKFVKPNFKISNGMLRHSLATLEGEQDFIFFTEPS